MLGADISGEDQLAALRNVQSRDAAFLFPGASVPRQLVCWATHHDQSRGRMVRENPSATRTEYQRDRDRIIHSGAFRKLRNKTQVFIESEGDYYRTRLTHSLEVAQIARSMARALGIDEDLTEALALAHDLGHTCFGHAGEDALNAMMLPYGGFDHNDHTLRILTKIEKRYLDFDGLNLTWETLEGCVKKKIRSNPNASFPPTTSHINELFDLQLYSLSGAEAQVAGIADDIAYNTHDLDDGFRAGLLEFDAIKSLPLFGESIAQSLDKYPTAEKTLHVAAAVRHAVGSMVTDALAVTRSNIMRLAPGSANDLRNADSAIVTLGDNMQKQEAVIRAFLHKTMYRHPRVITACEEADAIVRKLFRKFMDNPSSLPNDWSERASATNDESSRARIIADYIAGMTDRYARDAAMVL